jgi:diadenosine tetraphosphate (Ap4A) HIT family hydrolase
MQKVNCVFCHIKGTDDKIIFESEDFIFLDSKYPIIKGHCLLISKDHLRSEREFGKQIWASYKEASDRAYAHMSKVNQIAPFIFINAPQDQSIQHFHKHYMPGVFGVLGIEKALKVFVEQVKHYG